MDIDHVNRSLRNLLTLIEAREWDRVTESSDELVSLLNSVLTWKLAPGDAVSAGEAREIVTLLGRAVAECSERQSQIAPLLEALSRVNKRSAPP